MQSASEKIVRAIMPTAVAAVGLYVSLVIAPLKKDLENINARLDKIESRIERTSESQGNLQAALAEIRGQLRGRFNLSAAQPSAGGE